MAGFPPRTVLEIHSNGKSTYLAVKGIVMRFKRNCKVAG